MAGFWTLFGVVCGMQVWLSMLAHGHSLPRVIAYEVLVWAFWILLSAAILWLVRRFPPVPPRARPLLVHALAAVVFSTLHAAWWVGLVLLLKPYDVRNPKAFLPSFLEVAFWQMPLELLLYVLVGAAAFAGDYYRRYRERELRALQLEASLAEARLHALELQIQPHFLFNTLNAVSALVRGGDADQAVAMIAGLSDLLRYALDRAGDQRVAVADEVEMLRRYLEIQRLRFADRLSFEIDVAREADRAAIPVLLLQPLAENAIRHGIARVAAPGSVRLRAFRDGDTLRIEMLNSGRLDRGAVHGIGLSNTVARLEQLYGREQRFELRQSEEGVLARVSIPWSEVA